VKKPPRGAIIEPSSMKPGRIGRVHEAGLGHLPPAQARA
jgi:hypothetical protein